LANKNIICTITQSVLLCVKVQLTLTFTANMHVLYMCIIRAIL